MVGEDESVSQSNSLGDTGLDFSGSRFRESDGCFDSGNERYVRQKQQSAKYYNITYLLTYSMEQSPS
jgi:hypothetical protein